MKKYILTPSTFNSGMGILAALLCASPAFAYTVKDHVSCTIEVREIKFDQETKQREEKIVRKEVLEMQGPFSELKPDKNGNYQSYFRNIEFEKFNFSITLWAGLKNREGIEHNDTITFDAPAQGLIESYALARLQDGKSFLRFMTSEYLPKPSTQEFKIQHSTYGDATCESK